MFKNIWKKYRLAIFLTALTLFPPMWAIYTFAGNVGAGAAFGAYDALLWLYNVAIVGPQHMLTALFNESFHLHLSNWSDASFINFYGPSIGDKEGPVIIQSQALFYPLKFTFAALTYIASALMVRSGVKAVELDELAEAAKKPKEPQ